MKIHKIFAILNILFLLYILLCASSYVSAVSENLSNTVFRIHVIANSNSVEDQNLKYIVRDALINYINEHCINFSDKDEIVNYCIQHKFELETIATNVIYNNGFSYPVSIEIGNFKFPTKYYGNFSFPAGYYDALKVKIGAATGNNWWCVMFPPLCFINPSTGIMPDSSKNFLKNNLSDESFKIISNNNDDSTVKFKFKLIELLNKSENIKILSRFN